MEGEGARPGRLQEPPAEGRAADLGVLYAKAIGEGAEFFGVLPALFECAQCGCKNDSICLRADQGRFNLPHTLLALPTGQVSPS